MLIFELRKMESLDVLIELAKTGFLKLESEKMSLIC